MDNNSDNDHNINKFDSNCAVNMNCFLWKIKAYYRTYLSINNIYYEPLKIYNTNNTAPSHMMVIIPNYTSP